MTNVSMVRKSIGGKQTGLKINMESPKLISKIHLAYTYFTLGIVIRIKKGRI